MLDRIEYLDLLGVLDKAPKVAEWYQTIKDRETFQQSTPDFEYRMWGPKKPVPEKQVGSDAPYGSFPSE